MMMKGMFVNMQQFIRRILVYMFGLAILAFGITISINSNLGVSPVSSLSYIISLISRKNLGLCIVAVLLICILVQILILKKEFQWFNLFQILCSTMFGYAVDLSNMILKDFTSPTYIGRLGMLAVSIVLIAFGMVIYMSVDLMKMPMEGMINAMIAKPFKNKTFHEIKVVLDCAMVALGIILSFAFLGELQGIREGTVISAVLIGKVMPLVQKWCMPVINRFCYGKADVNK